MITLVLLVICPFLFIYQKETFFSTKNVIDYALLLGYLVLLALYTINTAFYHVLSDTVVFSLVLLLTMLIFSRYLPQKNNAR